MEPDEKTFHSQRGLHRRYKLSVIVMIRWNVESLRLIESASSLSLKSLPKNTLMRGS